MTEKQKEALQKIEDQLYAINARNISARYIGLRKTPSLADMMELNQMLAFIIKEIRVLRETGELDVDAVYREKFGSK